jgi:hypothetical protein
LIGKPEGNRNLEDVHVEWRIRLKQIFQEYGGSERSGFVWFGI